MSALVETLLKARLRKAGPRRRPGKFVQSPGHQQEFMALKSPTSTTSVVAKDKELKDDSRDAINSSTEAVELCGGR